MKIGIDTRELAGKKAGIGWYIYHVLSNILKLDTKNEYFAYSCETIDFPDFSNLTKIVIPKKGLSWHLETAKRIEKDDIELYWSISSPIVPAITKIPTIYTIHDLTNIFYPQYHKLKGRLIDKLFLAKAVKKTKKIIAISDATKKDIVKLFPSTKEKVYVTHLGYDKVFKPISKSEVQSHLEKYKLSPGYVLYVGTLEPRKNIETILKAYARIDFEIQKSHPLVIAGKKGWKYENIFKTYNELKLKEKVKFLDYLDFSDLPALYNGASVFVFPSFYEGFGLPPLESMACGTPVITSNISSLPEVVGNAGILVEPLDIDNIAQNIEKILTDLSFRQQLSDSAIKQASKFSWQKTAEETLKILT